MYITPRFAIEREHIHDCFDFGLLMSLFFDVVLSLSAHNIDLRLTY